MKFGDEELDPKEEKELQKQLNEQFKPLIDFLKNETTGVIRDGGLSTFCIFCIRVDIRL